MRTQFDVGQEVYVRGRVEGVTIDSEGVTYKVALPQEKALYTPKIEVTEGNMVSAEVEDFCRSDPPESDEEEAHWIPGDQWGDGQIVAKTSYCCSKCGWAWGNVEQLNFFYHCPSCRTKMKRMVARRI